MNTHFSVFSLFIIGLFLVNLLPVSIAGPTIIPVDGVNYTINTTIMENLNRLNGKKVSVTLNGGKIISGKVKSVGEHLVHIEKISGKEFFDALIQIEKIQAIETQFRKYQR